MMLCFIRSNLVRSIGSALVV